jgi:hypothetical protein
VGGETAASILSDILQLNALYFERSGDKDGTGYASISEMETIRTTVNSIIDNYVDYPPCFG